MLKVKLTPWLACEAQRGGRSSSWT